MLYSKPVSRFLLAAVLYLSCLLPDSFAQLRISEFMASNTRTLADEDGDFEDWIEIQNFSPVTVNLFDWSLTDSPGDLTRWRFPATILPPGSFLIVFASNKDRHKAGLPLHTNFRLDAAGEYLALADPAGNVASKFAKYPPQVPDVSFGFALTASNVTLIPVGATARVFAPSTDNGGNGLNYSWIGDPLKEPFDASSWTVGLTGMGFGAGGPGDIGINLQSSMLGQNASAFLRIPFVVGDPADLALLHLRLKYDDGFVVWLNGNELARANAPMEDLSWDSSATAEHPAAAFEDMVFGGASALLRPGTNILAIQGLNVTFTNGSFLILPELKGVTVAGETDSGLYFTQPTPGAENAGGAIQLGPGIAEVKHIPNVPLENDDLIVTAKVFPTARSVASVTLHYRVMFGAEVALPMLDDGAHGDGVAGDGIYGATIPASASTTGQMVRYYVTALDVNNVGARLPVFTDPTASAEYLGTVVNPSYVTSTLPVIHLFAPSSVLQPGPTTTQTGADSNGGGRVALFYDGEFYDNVLMFLRGNTTAGYNKKSHRVEFNREHPFRHNGPGGRVRKTSFVADYGDPTYMRQGLSYWLCAETGAAGPFYNPVRLQLNGTFYQLANHNDVHGEELLERLGYDPNGALYNAVGTVQSPISSTGGFEKKTRRWDGNGDYTAMAGAIAESLSTAERMTNVFDLFDLPQVISYVVAARFFHENDDVWANMSLYHDNDGDGLWRVIPFDVNLSWGAAFMDASAFSGIQVDNDDLKSFPLYGSSQALPTVGGSRWNRLYDVIFSVPQTREMVLRRMRTVLDNYVKPPGTPAGVAPVEQKAIAWRDLIAPEAQLDRNWWGWPGKGGQCNFDPGINLTTGVNDLLTQFIGRRRAHLYGKHSVTNTVLPLGISKSSNAGIPLAQPTNAAVAIVSWDYNPSSGNQDEEYVQLANPNSYAVDLSGWRLKAGVEFKFHGGTVIPANGSLYISPNTKAFRARAIGPRGGLGLFVVGPYDGHLNAWGESLRLTDDAGRLVSSNGFAGTPSPAQRYLRITEIMYNPSPAVTITNDEQQFEYVELRNISTNETLNLAGARFDGGISFDFTGSAVTTLAPGQTVLVVRNPAAFTARYGNSFDVVGPFAGVLDNGSEKLRLTDATGEKILEFDYEDNWYPITDGLGFSLVIVDESAPWDLWGSKQSWRASTQLNGSPGQTDPAPPVINPVLINEVLTHTDLPELDAVELFNPGTNQANIGGWFLTDDFYVPKKFRIPNGTTIPPGGFQVFDERAFNAGASAFRLNELGESVYLFSGNAQADLTGYSHGYEFGEAPNGVSFGSYTNSQTNQFFVLQKAVTLGTTNSGPRVGPIVISEVMYHPPDTNGVDNDLDEFIELENITTTNVRLYDLSFPTNTWRLRNAVDFDFPKGQTLAANSRLLIVGFNPADAVRLASFRAKYSVPPTVEVFGPWSGKLDNSGETIELKQPGAPDDTAIVPYYMIDKIAYRDDVPWTVAADGLGNSLQRFANTSFGNDPTNWFAAGATAGRSSIPDLPPTASITWPTNGAVLSSTNVVISVSAEDSDGSVALVQLLANNAEIGRWSVQNSNFLWTRAVGGIFEFRVRVTDDLGATAESAPVSVTIVSPPPTVVLSAPANGAILIVGSSVLLAASANSGGAPAAFVDYFVDGSLVSSVVAPFNSAWTANPPGGHTISARSRDGQGQVSALDSVSVFVQAARINPELIPAGADWRYLDDGSDQGTNWLAPEFSDNTWPSGPAKLGFNNGNNGLGTLLSYGPISSQKHVTYYFRREFDVPTLAGMSNLFLEVQRDDGVALYLNGTPFYRNNLPAGVLASSQLATNASDNGNTWQSATLSLVNLVPGVNLLAAEVHQSSRSSSDLAFNPRLTLLGTVLGPAITAHPHDRTATNGQTASFSVSATGAEPLTYQWLHSGTNLPGTTSNVLVLPAVSDANAGVYRVTVSNSVSFATSDTATLTVFTDDSDGDGIPDDWEWANGTKPDSKDAGEDLDRDGFTNWQEFLAGTRPTNPVSFLRLETVLVQGTDTILSFQAVSNRSYTVEHRLLMNSGLWFKWQDIPAVSSNRMIWLTNGTGAASSSFYRLVTPMQP